MDDEAGQALVDELADVVSRYVSWVTEGEGMVSGAVLVYESASVEDGEVGYYVGYTMPTQGTTLAQSAGLTQLGGRRIMEDWEASRGGEDDDA